MTWTCIGDCFSKQQQSKETYSPPVELEHTEPWPGMKVVIKMTPKMGASLFSLRNSAMIQDHKGFKHPVEVLSIETTDF